MNYRPWIKPALLVFLILCGIALELSGAIDLNEMLVFARGNAGHWWLILLLILLPALMFSFALAGSLFLWIVAPLYPPPLAALILAAGGTLGGLGAYWFANYLTQEWRHKIEKSHAYQVLQAQDNFFTLFAMRVFPAFPHSVVNYSAGLLKAKLSHFVIAALLGVGIKSYIYASVIHSASRALTPELLFDFSVVAPLVALSLLSALVVFLSYRRNKPED